MNGALTTELPSQFCGGITNFNFNFNIRPPQFATQQQSQSHTNTHTLSLSCTTADATTMLTWFARPLPQLRPRSSLCPYGHSTLTTNRHRMSAPCSSVGKRWRGVKGRWYVTQHGATNISSLTPCFFILHSEDIHIFALPSNNRLIRNSPHQ